MTTSLDLIESAAIKLGAIHSGEELAANEASDSLDVLNSMLDYLATKRLMVYQIVQDSYSWASGNASRTIGSGGNFDGTRPTKIESVFFRDSSNYDYPVVMLDRREAYDSIVDKSQQSTLPTQVYYNPAYPLGVLYAYPVPSVTLTCKINHWQVLQRFAALTTDLALPPGYRWMIEHNLAVALQPVFGLTAPPYVVAEAALSKKSLFQINAHVIVSSTDVAAALGGGGGYNINIDQ